MGALQKTDVPLALINGPADPVSGRHAAEGCATYCLLRTTAHRIYANLLTRRLLRDHVCIPSYQRVVEGRSSKYKIWYKLESLQYLSHNDIGLHFVF